MSGLDDVVDALKRHDDFLITAHENPDPDSVGSMIGLWFGLRLLGKRCKMVSSDPPPPELRWAGAADIQRPEDVKPSPAMIVLDCDVGRIGAVEPLLEQADLVINIDHHQGSGENADIAYVDTKQAATALMVLQILEAVEVQVDPPIAQALFGGIMGDTGGFRYANTDRSVLETAAFLVGQGADPAATARDIFETKPFEFLQLLGHVLSRMERSEDGRVVWLRVGYEDFQAFNLDPKQSDQFVQYARMVAGSDIAILFREVAPEEVRIGFRSHSVDVHALAVEFDGGGHRLASGARVAGPLDKVVERVVQAAQRLLQGGTDCERDHQRN